MRCRTVTNEGIQRWIEFETDNSGSFIRLDRSPQAGRDGKVQLSKSFAGDLPDRKVRVASVVQSRSNKQIVLVPEQEMDTDRALVKIELIPSSENLRVAYKLSEGARVVKEGPSFVLAIMNAGVRLEARFYQTGAAANAERSYTSEYFMILYDGFEVHAYPQIEYTGEDWQLL